VGKKITNLGNEPGFATVVTSIAQTPREFTPSTPTTVKVSESGAPTVKLAAVTMPATLSTAIVPLRTPPSAIVPDRLKVIVSAQAAEEHSARIKVIFTSFRCSAIHSPRYFASRYDLTRLFFIDSEKLACMVPPNFSFQNPLHGSRTAAIIHLSRCSAEAGG
jgi:hypothetical protein